MPMIPLEANDNDGPAALGMARRTAAMTDAEIHAEQIAALKRQLDRANARLLSLERKREKLRAFIASLTKRLAQAGDRSP